jgi:hypothetical protein
MKSQSRVLRGPFIFRIVICLAPLCCLATQASAQTERPCAAPSPVIAQSRDTGPTGELRVRFYRLEKQSDKTFCLSVKLDSIIIGSYLIWINDNPKWAYQLRRGEVTAVFPLDWLEQDARISVSKLTSREEVTSFKERLKLPEFIRRLQKETPAESLKISAIRHVYRHAGFKTAIFVEIEITKSWPFYPEVANNIWVIRIGRTSFHAYVQRNHSNRLSTIMSKEAFAKLKDGDLVRVGFGGAFTEKAFAKLDKSMLERGITQGMILRDVPDEIDPNPRYLFYLHGYIVESRNTRPVHPEFGAYEYSQILQTFEDNGFVVISEARKQDREIEPYARKLADQLRQLLKAGVPPEHITVVGASQGSWIAMLTSTYLENRKVNFVFIAACSANKEFLNIVNIHGNVMSIYERSDLAQSCRDYYADATGINDWKEVEVNTGLKHGFLYRPMKEWIEPTIAWAQHR